MQAQLYIPLVARTSFVLGFFVFAVVILHLLLVWPRNLSRRRWKQVDYIWLGAAVLGIIASVGANRREVALGVATTVELRLDQAAQEISRSLEVGASEIICSQFVRSEWSPPPAEFDRRQREFDALCSWFRRAREVLPSSPIYERKQLRLEDLGGPPPSGGDQMVVEWVQADIARYNEVIKQVTLAHSEARESHVEKLLRYIAPLLLAFALALRISKVTGELRLDAA